MADVEHYIVNVLTVLILTYYFALGFVLVMSKDAPALGQIYNLIINETKRGKWYVVVALDIVLYATFAALAYWFDWIELAAFITLSLVASVATILTCRNMPLLVSPPVQLSKGPNHA